MDKSQVTDILEEIATLLELKGENPFKARAYTNGARTLDTYEGDLGKLVAENRLGELAGIGDALQKKITELVTTGRLGYYEDLRASVPEGMLALMEIPSLGAKKINALHAKLGISSIAELEAACVAHKVRDLPGFGAKTEDKLLAGIQQARNYSSLHLYAEAWAQAEEIREAMREHEDVLQVSTAGSLRRGREVVHDLDFVASSRQPKAVMDYFVSLPWVKTVTNHGETKSSVLLTNGMSADLRIVSDKEYAYALHHFTGSKEHNIAMRQRAIAQGKKLSEWGLFITPKKKKSEDDDGELVKCHTEDEFFAALGSPVHPARVAREPRRDRGRRGKENPAPRRLDANCAALSTATPTGATARTRSPRWRARPRNSASITSASPTTPSPRSRPTALNEQRLAEQIELIAAYNKEHRDFRVFAGSEVDILKDGRLDFADDILAKLDYVVRLRPQRAQPRGRRDDRARHPRDGKTSTSPMLGHVTGRLLLAREASKINLEKIIDCAASTGTWIELNCSSMRMDMDWRWWHRARDKGVKCVINPDAHRVSQFAMLRHGVTFARKGWLRREDVINTQSLDSVKKTLAR